MAKRDIENCEDIKRIVDDFYDAMLDDPIIGFIFTDVAKVDLDHHLPLIYRFWEDVLFREANQAKRYHGNVMRVHKDLNTKLALRPGHFTRWLYLFNRAVDQHASGANAELIKQRAEMVAKAIAAALTEQKKNSLRVRL